MTGQALGSVEARIVSEVGTALRRRSSREARLSGAARVLAPLSANVRTALVDALGVMVRRAAFERPLYAGAIRALAEAGDRRVTPLLMDALSREDGGGLSTLSAACFDHDPALDAALARMCAQKPAHLRFAAGLAQVARGGEGAGHLTDVAPKIKESHRIALCLDVLLPLTRGAKLANGVAPALRVLRSAERHLGRWLVMAEIATRAGDPGPLDEAKERSQEGPRSARAAWSLVAWALNPDEPPAIRPTAELVARLSDRPSGDRDTTFLFRLGAAKAPSARAMLESLIKLPLADELSIRAAGCLLQRYDRQDLLEPLLRSARAAGRDELRGLATAVLWDAGAHERAIEQADVLQFSRTLSAQVWATLVRMSESSGNGRGPVLTETTVRRLQWGWVE